MNQPEPELEKPQAATESTILVVDDIARNIQIVGAILSEAGYEVMPATSGRQALERITSRLPDLVLLDLMMPEMDGLEVCRRLKAEPATKTIPVIFLTASTETGHLAQGFEAGAVDYVTKPFQPVELLARVRTHLELHHARAALIRQTARLQAVNEEKSEFLGIAAHDLRNPLNNVLFSCNLLLRETDLTMQDRQEMVSLMKQSAEHMLQLVKNLLEIHALEEGRLHFEARQLGFEELLHSCLSAYSPKAAMKHQGIVLEQIQDNPVIFADPVLARQVIENLLSNAIKYSPRGKHIFVKAVPRGDFVRLEVRDEGPGISQEDQKRLFGKFARLSARPTGGETSTGLGLSIVKRLVTATGGKVWCESKAGEGTTFIVEFPSGATDQDQAISDLSASQHEHDGLAEQAGHAYQA